MCIFSNYSDFKVPRLYNGIGTSNVMEYIVYQPRKIFFKERKCYVKTNYLLAENLKYEANNLFLLQREHVFRFI